MSTLPLTCVGPVTQGHREGFADLSGRMVVQAIIVFVPVSGLEGTG